MSRLWIRFLLPALRVLLRIFFLSLELRPDFGLLTTPQTLNIIVMTQQDQAGEH